MPQTRKWNEYFIHLLKVQRVFSFLCLLNYEFLSTGIVLHDFFFQKKIIVGMLLECLTGGSRVNGIQLHEVFKNIKPVRNAPVSIRKRTKIRTPINRSTR